MRILKLLAIILLVISPFLLHIWRKNMVNMLNIRIETLGKEVSIERNKVVKLYSRYREATSVSVIEKRAREELNMRYPRRKEVINLNELRKKRG